MEEKELIYQVKADEFVFSFSSPALNNADIVPLQNNTYSIIQDHQSAHAVIHANNNGSKQFDVEVDGEVFKIEIKTPLDQMLDQMGFGTSTKQQTKEIKAPMPGLVLNISVEEGQSVSEGNKLLILEAMKMENSIMINRDAVIASILVKPGQAVEKGQVLIVLE